MIKIHSCLPGLATLATVLALSGETVSGQDAQSQALAASIINIDFNGLQPPDDVGPTYDGAGAAGGGRVFNSIIADSRDPDGVTRVDNLTVGGTNLLNSLGEATTVNLTISPIIGDNNSAGSDPTASPALFMDYIAVVPVFESYTGPGNFTISGLGEVPFVDVYFYSWLGLNRMDIPGATTKPFAGSGIFTSANTVHFSRVAVTNGTVTGIMGTGLSTGTTVLCGMTIQKPLPLPFFKSASPTGTVKDAPTITVELEDYVTEVVPSSVQLLLNGQAVAATVAKPAGSPITTVTYAPAPPLTQGTTNTVTIIFGNSDATPVVQTNEFTFVVLDVAMAAATVNIDFTGARNVINRCNPGPTYIGVGAAGGGTVWNGILGDVRLPDGTDRDDITVTGDNLLNSLGDATTISFSIAPVGSNNPNEQAGTDPYAVAALFGDYLFVGDSQGTLQADFTISGLGDLPVVDVYFYGSAGRPFIIPGTLPTSFTAKGIFTPANTRFFSRVPVNNGTITGTMGDGTGPAFIMSGLTIQKPLPQPFIKSASPTGRGVRANASITVEVQDYISQVVPGTVQLLVNGQAVAATLNKPAGSLVTTVSYTPPSNWAQGSTNTFRITFGDNAATPVEQTHDFTFVVLQEDVAAATVNIDFTGARNVPTISPGPTFIGQSAAGGGTAWNGVLADSRLPDGTDNDNLTVSTNNLVNSLGDPTTISFSISPVSGSNPSAGTDPTVAAALFGDYMFVGSAGQATGMADFTISGLGTAPVVDLYFYFGSAGNFVIPGSSPTPFAGSGIFTSANTRYFAKVPVSNGTVTGTVGTGPKTDLCGLTIQKPLPQPFVKSASPAGTAVRANAAITVELQDYITQVAPSTVQLLVNGQGVAATVTKPAGASITSVTYNQAGGWAGGSTNSFRIIFGNNATPPILQTNDFTFVALNEALAAATINIDFNGVQNDPTRPPQVLGPTYDGAGAAGGGSLFNSVMVDSRDPDGVSRVDNLTVGGTNLLNSIGEATTVSITIDRVIGDNNAAGTDPTAANALYMDYLAVVPVFPSYISPADFTISGLGDVPYVDLYFYSWLNVGRVAINGATPTSFAGSGIFTSANTKYYAKVAVTNGTITGIIGTGTDTGTTVLCGMTIQKPLPQPGIKSASPTGEAIGANTAIKVELQDYGTLVVPNSVQLLVNGQAVTATVAKPAGSSITTITYSPAGGWVGGTTNTFRVIFGDNAVPPVLRTNDFTFVALNEALAAATINIDFNGLQSDSSLGPPDVLGPTYEGVGAAGGGRVFNGIIGDSRDPDGVTRVDNITAGGTNLLNSLGEATTVNFTISPVIGDNNSAGTDPMAGAALFNDYLAVVPIFPSFISPANFTISGLGDVPYVDVYVYSWLNVGRTVIPGATTTPFADRGIFTSANTVHYSKVAVTNGTVTGIMGFGPDTGTTVLCGLTIQVPLRQPSVKSASPTGEAIRANSAIAVELQDFGTQVVPGTVQLLVNGQAVAATVAKPAGSSITTVTYSPAGGWAGGSTNTFRIIFGDNSAPPVFQTNDFTFVVLNEALAAATINIDFNGLQPPDTVGPTYDGVGAAGGGRVFNGIVADSRDPDGVTRVDNLTVGGTNLLNSLGEATTVNFTIARVIGDNNGAGTDPTAGAALLSDYIAVVPIFPSFISPADFTISGLGSVPSVDVYVYSWLNVARTVIPGASTTPFAGSGIFTPANTVHYANVLVTNGTVTGIMGFGSDTGTTVLCGMTIQKPLPVEPGPRLSIARQDNTIILSWTGTATLQAADELTGQWVDIATTSPQSITPTASHKFYRLKK